MNDSMDPGQESGSIRGDDVCSQHIGGMGVAARYRHLCVVCVLMKHDFEERAPDPEIDAGEALPLAKAWIDGLPYRSVYHVASRGIRCTDCGEKVMMTYDPEYVHERPVALCTT